jgi:hypothetical protein
MNNNKLPKGWKEFELGEVLQYEQPGEYIVDSAEYDNENKTPVLTAGKTFILGYTDETKGIYTKLPVIIFDDFTTANHFVTFPFKVKSSAMKLLSPKIENINLKYVFCMMKGIHHNTITHKRYYISAFQPKKIPIPIKEDGTPDLKKQEEIIKFIEKAEKSKEWRKEADDLTDDLLNSIFLNMFGSARNNTKGFDVKGFLDVFDITTGKLDSNASVECGKYPFFTCSRETFKINDYSFDCEALLLAGNNAAGKYSVKHYKGKFNAYQRTYVLTLKNKDELFDFYHYQLGRKLVELQNKSVGTNTKYLTMGILKDIKMICPPTPLQNKFASIVKETKSLKEQQKHSKNQIDNLFNALMQKAFKGELKC